MGVGLTILWIKLKRWGLNHCCNVGGCWGKWSFVFSGAPFLQKNKTFIIHCVIMMYLPKLCAHTCITYFVNVCKDDLCLPTFTHISHNVIILTYCLYAFAFYFPKSKEKHCMRRYIDWDKRYFFSLYMDILFYLTNLYSAKKK